MSSKSGSSKSRSRSSEMFKCRGSVNLITGAIVLFLLCFLTLLIVGISAGNSCVVPMVDPTAIPTATSAPFANADYCNMLSSLVMFVWFMLFISFFMLIVGTVNAAYYGCFKTAIYGTLLAVLLF